MASQIEFLASGALGIGPALFFLWHSLRRFDYPRVEKTMFDDRKIFFALAVGLVMGTISSLFAVYSGGVDFVSVLIVIITVALFEESFKLVYLNRKGYRTNFASTYYGVSLGLGIAATVVLANGLRNPDFFTSATTFALLLVFSIGLCITEASTGAMIGFGCSRGEPWYYFFIAIFARFFYTFVSIPFLIGIEPEWLRVLSLFAALVVGVYLYYYTYTELLLETLPSDMRRLFRKARRERIKHRHG